MKKYILFSIILCISILMEPVKYGFSQDNIPSSAMKVASGKEEGINVETTTEKEDYETIIRGEKYRESTLMGKYKQPVWTTKRLFATTRIYVIPARQFEVEYWLITKGLIKEDEEPSFEHRLELEYGLGKRLMLDFYYIFNQKGYSEEIKSSKQSIELRYAFGDWGKIPLNPTFYFEWIRQSKKPQKIEAKILLGGQIAPRLFYGINLIYEVVLGDEYEMEYGISGGLSAVLIERHLLAGIEGKVAGVDTEGNRFHFKKEVKAIGGPTLQIKSMGRFHIDIVPLFGALSEDGVTEPYYEIYTIAGVSL